MKKLLYLMFVLLICNNVKADVSIPDGPFRRFLMNKYPSCFYTDVDFIVWMNTSCSQITSEDSLEFHNLAYDQTSEIFDLEGIQYFTSLKYLNCSSNTISTSPPLPASLLYLNYAAATGTGPFGTFPTNFLPGNLQYLDCSDNTFGTIAYFPASLHYINCSRNILSSLPALPPVLDTLICTTQEGIAPASNVLTALPALPSTLKYLNCSDNSLYSLPALPASLLYLDCSWNYYHTNPEDFEFSLAALPTLPPNLQYLNCRSNKLTSLPALPTSLVHLDCAHNRVYDWEMNYPGTETIAHEGIDLMPTLPSTLQYLDCSYNKLTELPPLPASLTYLNCSYNIYTDYLTPYLGGIQCIPRIPAGLTYISTGGTSVGCLPNSGIYTVGSGASQLCSVFNNTNNCSSTGIISGHIFYDNNSNGSKDAGENYRPNVEVQLSNGQHGYTSNNGYYELSADPGNYTLDIVAPALYAAAPSTINYTTSNYDTVIHNMIALQPTVMLDSMTVSLVPLNQAFSGFQLSYRMTYANVGTTVVSPSVVLNYDSSKLTYWSSNNAAIVNNNDHLSLAETNFTPGTTHNFTSNFMAKITDTLGTLIRTTAVVTAGTCTATDSALSVVIGSFDPNDKSATPTLTPQQVVAGTYINYIVRFQNTGTANAIKVLITDTLSSFLDPSTFKMVDASHTCKTTRIGNKLIFEFFNIQLPPLSVDEPGSHGFIRFAVKPLTTVPLNSVIPNIASIYFDLNAPIVTNIANTTIQLTTVPLTLLSFKAVNNTNNAALLYWNTANESNTAYFEIEQSTDSKNFTRVGSAAARGRGSNAYTFKTTIAADIVYYRLKMIDIDGRFIYSPVIQVRKNKDAESIVVLSNPATNTLSIISTDESLVNTNANIFNQQGMLVVRFVLKDGLQSIDVSRLATGVYYLRAGVVTRKIAISH